MAERQESRLKRNLTFWNLMGVAIGQIIGAGIMTMTGTAIGMTGTGVALAFMISPVLTLITDFPQGILSSCAPAVGGPYKVCVQTSGQAVRIFVYCVIYYIQQHAVTVRAVLCFLFCKSVYRDEPDFHSGCHTDRAVCGQYHRNKAGRGGEYHHMCCYDRRNSGFCGLWAA